MYGCLNCGAEFEAPSISLSLDDETGNSEINRACPMCGDTDIERLVPCEQCSELKPDDGEKYCDYCKSEVATDIGQLVNKLRQCYDSELVDLALEKWIEDNL
jgi:hypothetical protein